MKLSERTMNVLKNYAKISNSMYFLAGTTQKIMAPSKSVVSEVVIDEEMPQEFGVYDLSKLLSVMSLFNEPEITINADNMVLTENGSTATYWFTAKEMIKNIPPSDKSITLKSVDAAFELSKENLDFIRKSSSALSLTNFIIEGDGTDIKLTVQEADDKSSNKVSRKVGSTSETFKFIGDVENLKIVDDDYDVQACKDGIIRFSSKNSHLIFWVAIRKNQ